MPIRWDPILTRHVARALHRELAGATVRALRLDGAERDLVVLARGRTLVWRLHPSRGYPLLLAEAEPTRSDLPHHARIRGVDALPDERIVRFQLLPRRGGPAHDLRIELLGNQWNAQVVEAGTGVVRHVLWSRGTGRGHRVGERLADPAPPGRLGVDGALSLREWMDALAPLPSAERPRALVRNIAWTSPLTAGHLLGDDVDGPDEVRLAAGFARWRSWVLDEADERPVLLRTPKGGQPYPFPVHGYDAVVVPDLLAAFEAVALQDAASAPPAPHLDPDLERRLVEAAARARRKASILEDEKAALGVPEEARALGDLILARYARISGGASRATLEGFDGEPVEITLDPALPAHENARRYYDEAARLERAHAQLPGMIAEAGARAARLEALLERARVGTATVEEVAAALPPDRAPTKGGVPGRPLPFKTFRSSGQLEIRVGRGARHNDDLTFRHSAPGDVWLHARHAQGAHVILRWPGPGNPPARDLEEAATLAALHSRARTSGRVAVDWTYRKYVRKPRGSAPGAVLPDRVRTVFVSPDPAVEERLAIGDPSEPATPPHGDGPAGRTD